MMYFVHEMVKFDIAGYSNGQRAFLKIHRPRWEKRYFERYVSNEAHLRYHHSQNLHLPPHNHLL